MKPDRRIACLCIARWPQDVVSGREAEVRRETPDA